MTKQRCYFTEAARAAAAAKRRENVGQKALLRQSLEVFVVRPDPLVNVYWWEIRQFGALTIDRSPKSYEGAAAARAAGEAALADLTTRSAAAEVSPPAVSRGGRVTPDKPLSA